MLFIELIGNAAALGLIIHVEYSKTLYDNGIQAWVIEKK